MATGKEFVTKFEGKTVIKVYEKYEWIIIIFEDSWTSICATQNYESITPEVKKCDDLQLLIDCKIMTRKDVEEIKRKQKQARLEDIERQERLRLSHLQAKYGDQPSIQQAKALLLQSGAIVLGPPNEH